MLNLLKILPSLLTLLHKLIDRFREKQLIEQGAQQAQLKGKEAVDEAIAKGDAAAASDSVPVNTDSEDRANRRRRKTDVL